MTALVEAEPEVPLACLPGTLSIIACSELFPSLLGERRALLMSHWKPQSSSSSIIPKLAAALKALAARHETSVIPA